MRVFVLGNAAVDETFRLSSWPAPGRSVLGRVIKRDLGGKGANQAVVLARAGIEVAFAAAIGTDAGGQWIEAQLACEGITGEHLLRLDAGTDRSVILVDEAGENATITTADCTRVLGESAAAAFLKAAAPGDALVLQGNLSADVTEAALREARTGGLLAIFNPSPVDPAFAALWPLVDLAIVNRSEAAELTGLPDPEAASQAMLTAGAGHVVVTLGAEGAFRHDAEGMVAVPAVPSDAVDTTGAGDTFAAVVTAQWLRAGRIGAPELAAAAAAAAITISRPGTYAAFPSQAELAAILER